MSFTEREMAAREKVLGILAEQKVESYVAYGQAPTDEWHHVGQRDHVVPQPDLTKAWSVAGAAISYHHSHPDDRSLSPSDLRQLCNPGLEEIWAHCPSGISYRAALPAAVSVNAFQHDHEHLNGTMSEPMARDFVEACLGAGALPRQAYLDLSDRAFGQALAEHGVLDFAGWDSGGGQLGPPNDPAYAKLVALSRAVLDRKWPPPPI
jgi:hypothetical protein